MIYFNPSGAPPFSSLKNIYEVIFLSIAFSGSFYFLLQYLMIIKRVNYFLINLIIQCIVIILTCIYLGLYLHRDYFSALFLIITIYYSVFLSKIDIFKNSKLFYKSVHFFSTLIIIVIFGWILLMGYAIVKREEPRWIESILYNIYFLFLIIILYYKNFKISYLIKRKIVLRDENIFIDDFDLSDILGIEYIKILLTFFTNKKANCSHLNKIILDEKSNCKSDCEKKAHLCNYYRNLYNKINYIKKVLELLKIGTVKSPSNKMLIKNEGWYLHLEKDCLVQFEEK